MTEEEIKRKLRTILGIHDNKKGLYELFDAFNLLSKRDRMILMNEVSTAFHVSIHPFNPGKYNTRIICKDNETRHVYYFDGYELMFKGGRVKYGEDKLPELIVEDTYGTRVMFEKGIRVA